MSDALGLSIGTTNLVAIRDGRPPVSRKSIVTLFTDRAPEVGSPDENPELNQPGLELTSFVERVGDPVSMVASDGSSHRAEVVLVDALDAMARAAGGGSPVTIAVPAYWSPAVVGALRAALAGKQSLAANGVPASIIPDSGAALAALRAAPGLPPNGIVVLCDFGGSGTSITLADASAGLAIAGDTVRYQDFSGDHIDGALLNQVVAGIADANDADAASTAAVGSLTQLRAECRAAKERLSAETVTALSARLPGYTSDVRVTRPELERLIDESLGGLLNAVEDTLQRYRIPLSGISAVATVGGGAAIPLVTQRLSERLRAPVVTTPAPQLVNAAGAGVAAALGLAPDTPTGLAPVVDAPTGLAPTMGWVGEAPPTQQAPVEDASTASTGRALAWSQDDENEADPTPYAGADYESEYTGPTDARPSVVYAHEEEDDLPDSEPLAWYKRPPILFGAAAAAALLAAGGLAITLTSSSEPSGPITVTGTSYSNGTPVPVTTAGSESQTVTVTNSNGETSTSVVPPATTTSATTSPTTTTTSPTTTTTTTTTTTPTTTTTTPTTTTTTTVPPITPITPITPPIITPVTPPPSVPDEVPAQP
ncbi:MAG: hypothetical protein QOK33_1962 [Mycobacterium sp.]|nr:hypothetical protein [Mycobacterium sp.]